MSSAWRLVVLAAVGELACACLLTGIRVLNEPSPWPGPPGVGVAGFWAAFGSPGLIALAAVRSRRRSGIVAAAALSTVLSIVAFSGVTLVLLIPATVLWYSLAKLSSADVTSGDEVSAGESGARGVAGNARGGWASAPTSATSLVRIALAFGFGFAGMFVLLLTTTTVCWTQMPDGARVTTTAEPAMRPILVVGMGSGCDSGAISVLGAVGSLVLTAGAVSTVLLPIRR